MVDFKALKRQSGNSLDALRKDIDKTKKVFQKEDDPRFWQMSIDSAKNGAAIIRWLPSPDENEPDKDGLVTVMNFIKYWDFGWKNDRNGKWYIEKCLNSLGLNDPVKELNDRLYAKAGKDKKHQAYIQAASQRRRTHYISNILVERDPAKPECDGKVFLFDYGAAIFNNVESYTKDKVNELTGKVIRTAFNPYCPWTGATFNFICKEKDSYANYDDSYFDECAPLGTDKEIEAIFEQCHGLKEFLDPKLFKDYDVLKKRLHEVLEIEAEEDDEPARQEPREERKTAPRQEKAKAPVEDLDDDVPFLDSKPITKPKDEPKAAKVNTSVEDDLDAEGDGMAFFQNLLKKDE